jgi:hypothetical protein
MDCSSRLSSSTCSWTPASSCQARAVAMRGAGVEGELPHGECTRCDSAAAHLQGAPAGVWPRAQRVASPPPPLPLPLPRLVQALYDVAPVQARRAVGVRRVEQEVPEQLEQVPVARLRPLAHLPGERARRAGRGVRRGHRGAATPHQGVAGRALRGGPRGWRHTGQGAGPVGEAALRRFGFGPAAPAPLLQGREHAPCRPLAAR